MNPENPSCPAPLVAFRLRHRDSWGPCALRWSSGSGDGAPDGLTPEDFHDMARMLESTARCIKERGRQEVGRKKKNRGEGERHYLFGGEDLPDRDRQDFFREGEGRRERGTEILSLFRRRFVFLLFRVYRRRGRSGEDKMSPFCPRGLQERIPAVKGRVSRPRLSPGT